MFEWFNEFPEFIQAVIIIAAVATIIMIIQIIMILIGIGLDADIDTDMPDVDSDFDMDGSEGFLGIFGLKLLSVRNFIAFFAIGGWTLVVIYQASLNYALSISLGIVAGIITMVLFTLGMNAMMKLQDDGTKNMNNAVGKSATVYLTIPAKRGGIGKINVVVQETLMECDAMTEDDESIKTGEVVEILEVNDGYLLVTKK